MRRGLQLSLRLLLSLALLPALAWAVLALYFRVPGEWLRLLLPVLFAGAALFGLVQLWRRPPLRALLGLALLFGALQLWWQTLEPSNDRDWADDVAETLHGELHGDRLIVHNLRNFDWHGETDYEVRWETREYDLRQLRSVDLITSYWGMPAIAHILVSFGFENGEQLAFSVEIRKERHEQYSELGGFFKEFELSIVATDERDAVRVRSNHRGEDLYLYRIDMDEQTARALLLSYIERANRLREEPRFYNTLTANCTTIVFEMLEGIVGHLPLDYRLLATGYLPAYVAEQGGLQPGYSLDELRRLGRITERAQAADRAADFSARIRQGVPGY